ncbi:MAG TPA: hypothetical protein VNO55_13315 [Polyangia bacterium]|nr:hypothetical protein [Polyangia bacterium]
MKQLPPLLILIFTMLAAHGCGTSNPLPVQTAPQGDAAATGGSTGSHDAGSGGSGGGACRVDADCRMFDDYCTGCNCRALAKGDPDPTCSGPGVRCLVQPCLRKTVACVGGRCVVAR